MAANPLPTGTRRHYDHTGGAAGGEQRASTAADERQLNIGRSAAERHNSPSRRRAFAATGERPEERPRRSVAAFWRALAAGERLGRQAASASRVGPRMKWQTASASRVGPRMKWQAASASRVGPRMKWQAASAPREWMMMKWEAASPWRQMRRRWRRAAWPW